MELAGKHVVVTGAAGGIGRAMCLRFAAEGAAAIVVADIDGEGADAVAVEVGGLGLAADVSRLADIQRVVDEAEKRSGPIDLFCSNAGIVVPGGVEVAEDDWQRIWGINVMAHIHAAKVMVPRMVERGGGYLLNTVSAAGLLSQIGSAPYSVTKHAAIGLAESISIEHGDQGIRVSVLCPQAVRTAMTAGSEAGGVAGVDGMMEPEEVVQSVIEGLASETFLILPHPEVRTYMQRKTGDYDRWLSGMRRLQARYSGRAI